jgi:DNA adenine methylase
VTRYVGGPILRYGGKVRLAEHIVPRLPRGRMYVEPFFGAGGLFFAIPEGAYDVEVVNDIDHSLVTFFQVLRERPQDLRRVLELTPYSREEFRRALETSTDPLEEARRVWVRARQSINGVARVPGNWSRPTVSTSNRQRRGESKLADVEAFAARLRRVAIDCRDGADLVARFAEPGVSMYLDPPYHPKTRRTFGKDAYAHELTADDHDRLLTIALGAVARGARVAISGYPCDVYDEALVGWRRHTMQTTANTTTVGDRQDRTEVLWMSYGPEHELARVAQLDLEVRT